MFDFLLTKSLEILINLKYLGLFIAAIGFPVPTEIVIAVLAANGQNIWMISLIFGIGSTLAFDFTYFFGYLFTIKNPDTWLGGRAKFLRIDKEKMEKSRQYVIKNSFIYIFLTRFLPWLRIATSMASGFFRVNIFTHTISVFIGMFLYSMAIAYLGMKVGGDAGKIIKYLNLSDKSILFILSSILVVYIGFKMRKQIAKLIIKISKKFER